MDKLIGLLSLVLGCGAGYGAYVLYPSFVKVLSGDMYPYIGFGFVVAVLVAIIGVVNGLKMLLKD